MIHLAKVRVAGLRLQAGGTAGVLLIGRREVTQAVGASCLAGLPVFESIHVSDARV